MFTFFWLPTIVRMLLVFFAILLMVRKKVPLGAAFLTGSAILGIVFGMTPLGLLKSGLSSLFHPKTLALSMVVILILGMSRSMEDSGRMKRLLESFQGMVRHPGVNLVFFPAIIGRSLLFRPRGVDGMNGQLLLERV